jgi:hypothetical protein
VPAGAVARHLALIRDIILNLSGTSVALLNSRRLWVTGVASAGIGDGGGGSSGGGSGSNGSVGGVGLLQGSPVAGQQLQLEAAAAAVAVADGSSSHLPAYGEMHEVWDSLERVLRDEIACARTIVEVASRRADNIKATGANSSSSSSTGIGADSDSNDMDGNCDTGDPAWPQLRCLFPQQISRQKSSMGVWKAVQASGVLQSVSQQMSAVGLAMCAELPVPWCCNNPDCTNMAGVSELQLVGGESCVCGGCRVAR